MYIYIYIYKHCNVRFWGIVTVLFCLCKIGDTGIHQVMANPTERYVDICELDPSVRWDTPWVCLASWQFLLGFSMGFGAKPRYKVVPQFYVGLYTS